MTSHTTAVLKSTDKISIQDRLIRSLQISLFLYVLSTQISMAGMEIFGWTTATLTLLLLLKSYLGTDSSTQTIQPPLFFGFGGNAKSVSIPLSKSQRINLPFIDLLLLSLNFVIILSSLVTGQNWKGQLSIAGTSRFILLFFLLRFALQQIRPEQIQKTFHFLMVLMIFISAYGIWQHFSGIDLIRHTQVTKIWIEPNNIGKWVWRSRGVWSHPVTYGHSINLIASLIAGIFLFGISQRPWTRVLSGVSLIFCSTALFFSYTRGAWLGFIASLFIMSLYLSSFFRWSVIISSISAILVGTKTSEYFSHRVLSMISSTDESNMVRINLWKANWLMFKEHPLLGVGYGENENIVKAYFTKLGIPNGYGGHAHNNFLQFLSGTGLFGFSIYLAISICFLWQTHVLITRLPKNQSWPRALALGALGAQVALHVGGLTECNFKDAEVNHPFMFILAIICVLSFRFHSTLYPSQKQSELRS